MTINWQVCVTSDKSDHLISSELLTNIDYIKEIKIILRKNNEIIFMNWHIIVIFKVIFLNSKIINPDGFYQFKKIMFVTQKIINFYIK
jgi:hypothetical protein